MTNKAISPLRRRLIEDMAIRRLSPKTQYQYIRHVKKFADYLGRSADKATVDRGREPHVVAHAAAGSGSAASSAASSSAICPST